MSNWAAGWWCKSRVEASHRCLVSHTWMSYSLPLQMDFLSHPILLSRFWVWVENQWRMMFGADPLVPYLHHIHCNEPPCSCRRNRNLMNTMSLSIGLRGGHFIVWGSIILSLRNILWWWIMLFLHTKPYTLNSNYLFQMYCIGTCLVSISCYKFCT